MRIPLSVTFFAIFTLAVLLASQVGAQSHGPLDGIKAQIKLAMPAEGLATAGSSAQAAGSAHLTGRPPRTGTNVQVSQDQDPAGTFRSGASELSLAVTNNGNHILVGWNDGEGFGFAPFSPGPPLGLSGYGYSLDGGVTAQAAE